MPSPSLRLATLALALAATAAAAAPVPLPAPPATTAPAASPPTPPPAPTPATDTPWRATDTATPANGTTPSVNATDPTSVCAAVRAWGFSDVPTVVVASAGPPSRATNTSASKATATVCRADGSVDWSGRVRVRVRGGTNTQRYNKILSYAITDIKNEKKTKGDRDGGGGKKGDAPVILGMPAARQMILLGQQNDTLGVKTWTGEARGDGGVRCADGRRGGRAGGG